MVFSLFRKLTKSPARRLQEADPALVTPSTLIGGDGDDRSAKDVAAREAARRTAQKIDEIENEIIADALTTIGRYRDTEPDLMDSTTGSLELPVFAETDHALPSVLNPTVDSTATHASPRSGSAPAPEATEGLVARAGSAAVDATDFSAIRLDTLALDGGELPRASAPPAMSPAASAASQIGSSAFSANERDLPFDGFETGGSAAVRLAEEAERLEREAAGNAQQAVSFDEDFLSFDDLPAADAPMAPASAVGVIAPRGSPSGSGAVVMPASGVTIAARTRSAADDDLAIDIIDGSLPGQLEEAAILFSNGQHEPTVDALKIAVEDDSLSGAHRTLAWQMLFDLFRVMGERDSFESLAIRYASITESSPPPWSDELRYPERRDPNRRRASPSHVIAAGMLDVGFRKYVEQLLRAASHKRECSLDFSELSGIDADAAREIERLVIGFRDMSHPISFIGLEQLYTAATAHIESGRRDPDELFWQLALTTLRLMGEQVRFDDLSIEYCVTYEVSPPPWQPMPSFFQRADVSIMQEPAPEADEAGKPDITLPPDLVVFSGDLTGKIQAEIKSLRVVAETNEVVRIDCKRLRRVDFVAAGELLNELVKLRSAGRVVQFLQPNFLVYALMLVMGIHEMSQIRRRKL